MNSLKVIVCPPLAGGGAGGPSRLERRPTGRALLAIALLAPAMAGCPGHLENIAFLQVDAAPARAPSIDAPISVADAAPVAVPPGPDVTPPAVQVEIDPLTCSQPAEVLEKILKPNCAPCHGGNMPPAGLDLSTAGAKMRMLGTLAKNVMCMGRPLVAVDLVSNVFLDKINGAGCGMQMPLNKPPLSPQLVKCLTDWIKPPPPAPPAVDRASCMQPAEIAAKILTPKCALSGCHVPPAPTAGLDFMAAGARAKLVGIAARSPLCMGRPLANPADGTGVLFDKISGTACGTMMPAMGTYLSNQERWCLKEWIRPMSGGVFPEPPVTLTPPAVPPGAPAATCATEAEILGKVFNQCMPCHAAVAPQLGLDLESPGVKQRLLNVPAKGCIGKILANPDGTGHLFDKLIGPVPATCGMPMPYGGLVPLRADEVACLRAWIRL